MRSAGIVEQRRPRSVWRRLLVTGAAAAGVVGAVAVAGATLPQHLTASSPASVRAVVPGAPSAPANLTGYQVVAQKFDSVGNFTRAQVNCPAGKVAIGGGAEAQGVNSILNGSFPTSNDTGWIGIGHQPGFSSVGLMVYAICAVVTSP
jgi:hypothetical protein